MLRVLIACIVVVLLSGQTPAQSKDFPPTSDPNHRGWTVEGADKKPVQRGDMREPHMVPWKDVETDCLPCKSLVTQYNTVMQEVMQYRRWIAFTEWDARMRDATEVSHLRQGGTSGGEARLDSLSYHLSKMIDSGERAEGIVRKAKAQLAIAEAKAQQLRRMIADCEKQCEGKVNKTSGIKIGGLPAIAGVDPKKPVPLDEHKLDFDWKGPYPDVCFKCAKLAKRLNELPGLARENQVELASLNRTRAAGVLSLYYRSREQLNVNLKAIKENFNATLALYKDCIKTCKKKTACYQPERSYENISIGPNDTYGSGAEVKETVAGLVGGKPGLGGLGGGGSFGGGLGGKRSGTGSFSESATKRGAGGKEPEMVDDTTTGSFFKASAGEVDMQLRGNFNDDGLLVSAKLDDVPGDGTFHAMWLEDNEGRIIRPTRYLPYSMYRDWQLKVWWTYDRWVDGQHVEHREGGWTETWREERDGLLAFYGGEEGVKNSIWYSQGFDTPVRGIQHLGALFPVTADDLSGDCPLRLVTHVALPKEDPVVTLSVVSDFGIEPDTASSAPNDDIIVNIRQTFTF